MIINESKDKKNKLVESANEQFFFNSDEYENTSNEELRMIISDQIGANNQGESDAIRGYYRLITLIRAMIGRDPGSDIFYQDQISIIEEIISDEKNHELKLIAMRNIFDGGIPTNKD